MSVYRLLPTLPSYVQRSPVYFILNTRGHCRRASHNSARNVTHAPERLSFAVRRRHGPDASAVRRWQDPRHRADRPPDHRSPRQRPQRQRLVLLPQRGAPVNPASALPLCSRWDGRDGAISGPSERLLGMATPDTFALMNSLQERGKPMAAGSTAICGFRAVAMQLP